MYLNLLIDTVRPPSNPSVVHALLQDFWIWTYLREQCITMVYSILVILMN